MPVADTTAHRRFGHQEVFHGLTIVAGAAHYLLIARYVLPLT